MSSPRFTPVTGNIKLHIPPNGKNLIMIRKSGVGKTSFKLTYKTLPRIPTKDELIKVAN